MTNKNRLLFILLLLVSFSCGVRKAQITQKEKQAEPVTKVTPRENILEDKPVAVPPSAEEERSEIFVVVEEMPRFPGCEDTPGNKYDKKNCAERKMLDYIYANIQYPEQAAEEGIQGTCIVSFIVAKNGTIKNAKVLRDVGGGLGEEALRVVNSMNENGIRWIPGKQRGVAVDVRFNLPVKFRRPGE